MAIIRQTNKAINSTESVAILCTAVGVMFGNTIYNGSRTVTYEYPVSEVIISSCSSGTASYTISENTVTFSVSGAAGTSVTLGVIVTMLEPVEVKITDIKATSEREINYAKTSSGKYLWTRPTAIDLQFPWDAFSSWSLTRASSLNPDVKNNELIAYSGGTSTTGTNTYTFSNVYYGDTLKFSYSAKPGAVIEQPNDSTFTVDPTFSVSNITASKSSLEDPVIELSSQWDFGEGNWNTVMNTDNRAEFTLTVTKPDNIKSLPVTVGIYRYKAEAYYRKNLNLTTYTDTTAYIYQGDTMVSISSTSYTSIGTIEAGELSKNFTLKVVADEGDYHWPKYVYLYVRITIPSDYKNSHYFSSEYRTAYEYAGTITSNGSSGGSGYVPGSGATGGAGGIGAGGLGSSGG